MSSRASSWTLMEDFFVQECCVHGTDLENHGPTSILCDDPLPIESNGQSEDGSLAPASLLYDNPSYEGHYEGHHQVDKAYLEY